MYHTGNRLINPTYIIERAHIMPGMHVADFGCGSLGHVLFPVAAHITDSGAVYAVDIQKKALHAIKQRAALHSIEHIHPVWSDIERIGATAIPEGTLDVALLIMTLHQIEQIENSLQEILRLMKHKSRLVIVEWNDCTELSAHCAVRHIPEPHIRNWAMQQGLHIQEELDLPNHLYGFVLFRHA